MPIFVKFGVDNIFALDVEEAHTIEDVKAKIQELESIPPNQQRLIYKEEADLMDEFTLRAYHIRSKAVLHLVVATPPLRTMWFAAKRRRLCQALARMEEEEAEGEEEGEGRQDG